MRALSGTLAAMVATSIVVGAHADPKADCIAAADQAQTLRDDGKYRAARDKFVSCTQTVCPAIVQTSCNKWLHDIEGAMPSLVLGAKDKTGGDLADVRVTLDGTTLTNTLDGKPIEVDPGTHTLRFSRDGDETVTQKLIVRAGEKTRVVSVTMQDAAKSAPVTITKPEEAPSTPSLYLARNVAGASLIVLGAGGIALGVVFGLQASSSADDAAALRTKLGSPSACTHGPTADCTALSDAVDAQDKKATLSLVTYIAGGALIAGGVLAFLLWPKPKSNYTETAAPTARLVPVFNGGFGGASLFGTF